MSRKQVQLDKPRGGFGGRPSERISFLQQQRRKWSDWSECSPNCLKVRHRLNCDDILAQNQSKHSGQPTDPANGSPQAISSSNLDTLKPSSNRLVLVVAGEPVVTTEGQFDDDDYADEGDDENESDSCEKVEASKTFEERTCTGGQCKALPVGEMAAGGLAGRPRERYVDQQQAGGQSKGKQKASLVKRVTIASD